MFSYRDSERVFTLPGDISPFLVPKLFLFLWVALSLGILASGVLAGDSNKADTDRKNWPAFLALVVVVVIATAFMPSVGYIAVAPIATFACFFMLGYRNYWISVVVALLVPLGLHFLLVELANLSLPRFSTPAWLQ